MKSLSVWPAVIVLSAVLAGLFTFTNSAAQARIAIDMWFLLICPGMTLARFFDLREPLVEWMLAVALSLALAVLVAIALLVTGRWSPTAAFAIILGLTVLGALTQEVGAFHIGSWRRNL